MSTLKTNFILFALGIILFVVTLTVFNALTHTKIYEHSLGLITDVYHKDSNGNNVKIHEPYDKISNTNLINWDAFHYNVIATIGYDNHITESERFYAFFPLFPYIWRSIGASNAGICITNYLLFIISILLLMDIFFRDKSFFEKAIIFIVSIVLPQTVTFNIPYSEATFLACFSLGFWGIMNNKYWLYIIGMILLGMTRPAINILTIAFICIEFYYFLFHLKVKKIFLNLLYLLVPLFVGTLIAMLIQYRYSGNLFSFIAAQKCWGTVGFCFPTQLADWSQNGYSMNVFCIVFIVFPSILYFFKELKEGYTFVNEYKIREIDNSLTDKDILKKRFQYYGMLYFIGFFVFIVFRQGGSLHGLQRFIAATPLFFIFIYSFYDSIVFKPKTFGIYGLFVLLTVLFFSGIQLIKPYGFDDLGAILFLIVLLLMYFRNVLSKLLLFISLTSVICACIVWKTFLFQIYICGSWIYN